MALTGKIKGKGTSKSDSIKAKLKTGSFIVPSENAKQMEKKHGKQKANLNQKGGVAVRVSNGEYLVSPQKAKQIGKKKLNKLAPKTKYKA